MKSEDAKSLSIFESIRGKIVFSSDRMMILEVEVPPGAIVPEHSHPHEQMGLCLQGRAEFGSGEGKQIVEAGMFYWIEPNEKHSVRNVGNEKGIFIDIFSPPREEYLKKLQ